MATLFFVNIFSIWPPLLLQEFFYFSQKKMLWKQKQVESSTLNVCVVVVLVVVVFAGVVVVGWLLVRLLSKSDNNHRSFRLWLCGLFMVLTIADLSRFFSSVIRVLYNCNNNKNTLFTKITHTTKMIFLFFVCLLPILDVEQNIKEWMGELSVYINKLYFSYWFLVIAKKKKKL